MLGTLASMKRQGNGCKGYMQFEGFFDINDDEGERDIIIEMWTYQQNFLGASLTHLGCRFARTIDSFYDRLQIWERTSPKPRSTTEGWLIVLC